MYVIYNVYISLSILSFTLVGTILILGPWTCRLADLIKVSCDITEHTMEKSMTMPPFVSLVNEST